MATQRLPDWQARLGYLMQRRQSFPFTWGMHDCCSFAADAVQACTGIDPAAESRTYDDERGAARSLQKFGGVTGVADALFGERVPPLLARVGDVGLVNYGGRDSLAVCNGDTWLAPGERGLVALPLDSASAAWRY